MIKNQTAGMMWTRLNMLAQKRNASCYNWNLLALKMPSSTTTFPFSSLASTKLSNSTRTETPFTKKRMWTIPKENPSMLEYFTVIDSLIDI